jgi:hypothetical protein
MNMNTKILYKIARNAFGKYIYSTEVYIHGVSIWVAIIFTSTSECFSNPHTMDAGHLKKIYTVTVQTSQFIST